MCNDGTCEPDGRDGEQLLCVLHVVVALASVVGRCSLVLRLTSTHT